MATPFQSLHGVHRRSIGTLGFTTLALSASSVTMGVVPPASAFHELLSWRWPLITLLDVPVTDICLYLVYLLGLP